MLGKQFQYIISKPYAELARGTSFEYWKQVYIVINKNILQLFYIRRIGIMNKTIFGLFMWCRGLVKIVIPFRVLRV